MKLKNMRGKLCVRARACVCVCVCVWWVVMSNSLYEVQALEECASPGFVIGLGFKYVRSYTLYICTYLFPT